METALSQSNPIPGVDEPIIGPDGKPLMATLVDRQADQFTYILPTWAVDHIRSTNTWQGFSVISYDEVTKTGKHMDLLARVNMNARKSDWTD